MCVCVCVCVCGFIKTFARTGCTQGHSFTGFLLQIVWVFCQGQKAHSAQRFFHSVFKTFPRVLGLSEISAKASGT